MVENSLRGKRAVVVGAGVIGLSTAYFLQKAGADVTVVERRKVGSGASRGNGGLVVITDSVPLPSLGMISDGLTSLFKGDSSFYVHFSAAPKLLPFLINFGRSATNSRFTKALRALDQLNAQTMPLFDQMGRDGVGTAVSTKSLLRCYISYEKAQKDFQKYTKFEQRGLAPAPERLLNRRELTALEPALGDAVQYGFVQQGDVWTDPSRFVDELWRHLVENGVMFAENEEVVSVREHGDQVHIKSMQSTHRADYVVITAGAETRKLAAESGIRLILESGKGYSFSVEPKTMPQRALMFGDAHIEATPLATGRLRIAGTMEFDGSVEGLNGRRIDAIRDATKAYVTGVDWGKISDKWVGARPMTPDGLPYIGLVPGKNRTLIATGHNMLGFSLAPATGQLVTNMLLGSVSPSFYQPFDVARFDRRNSKADFRRLAVQPT